MVRMILYFDNQTGCLVGINLSRDPKDNEIVMEYYGNWPPPGYTFRLDLQTNEVTIVPLSECEEGGGSGYGGEEHAYAQVWLSSNVRAPCRGAFGVPFDQYDDPYGLLLDINHGIPILKPGVYHIWGQVTYSIVRHFAIVSRDLILTINGREHSRNSISIYTRGQFTQVISPAHLYLEQERNAIGIISEPTVSVLREGYRPTSYPVVIIGGRNFTNVSFERLE